MPCLSASQPRSQSIHLLLSHARVPCSFTGHPFSLSPPPFARSLRLEQLAAANQTREASSPRGMSPLSNELRGKSPLSNDGDGRRWNDGAERRLPSPDLLRPPSSVAGEELGVGGVGGSWRRRDVSRSPVDVHCSPSPSPLGGEGVDASGRGEGSRARRMKVLRPASAVKGPASAVRGGLGQSGHGAVQHRAGDVENYGQATQAALAGASLSAASRSLLPLTLSCLSLSPVTRYLLFLCFLLSLWLLFKVHRSPIASLV